MTTTVDEVTSFEIIVNVTIRRYGFGRFDWVTRDGEESDEFFDTAYGAEQSARERFGG